MKKKTERPAVNATAVTGLSRHKVQILNGEDGLPAFAVIPYRDYMTMVGNPSTIPNEVASKVMRLEISPIRAWREYLGLTQTEVAQRLGISQATYARQENSQRLRRASKEKIASSLGLRMEQLDV